MDTQAPTSTTHEPLPGWLAPEPLPYYHPEVLRAKATIRENQRAIEQVTFESLFDDVLDLVRDPSLWAQVAALVEAVQIEPLTPEQWRAGWLAPMLENHPGASPEQRLWAEQVMLPSEAGWAELAKLRSGRGSLSLREWPEVQAMKASLTLRDGEAPLLDL